MIKKKYHILGKVFEINTAESFEGNILHQELDLYPQVDQKTTSDIVINYLDKLEKKEVLLRNPSSHAYYEDSFRIELINASIEFYFNGNKLTQIDFCIKQGNKIRAIANKWFSYQFTNRKESIGFIFHELILIPSAFFFPDLTIVHASAINSNGAVLFGGTGGVGKTSLELELCNNEGNSFFADDIVVVNNNGDAYPNLSYPKIYGYNLINNDELRKKLFSKAGILNKVHWNTRKSINPAIVRRRVNPIELYGNVTNQPKKLRSFYVLVKDGKVNEIEIQKISPEEASELNKLVIETEYQIFYKHILWDEFNSKIANKDARISYNELINRIEKNLLKALDGKETFLIKIPMHMNHKDFLRQISSILDIK